jgi:hypothetical protein
MSYRITPFKLIIITCLFFGCAADNKDGKQEKNAITLDKKKENLNISILIDLSDRIDPVKYKEPSMEFYKRDLGYIESISKAFEKHLSSKPIIKDDDQIQVYFEPAPLNGKINDLATDLRLSFTKENTTKKTISKISPQYALASNQIYNLAIRDKKYLGSDIWSFFKNNVNGYCIKPNHRNILFILTDGYMFHKDSKFRVGGKTSYITPELVKSLKLNTADYKNQIQKKGYGFVKANDDLSNLEVFVLGINPARGNPFEGDVIEEYWMKWLDEMKIKKPIMKFTDLPSNLDPIIQKYINP